MKIIPKIFLLKIFLITYLFACGKKKNVVQQINSAVDRNTSAQKSPKPLLDRFIPKGYSILDTASGNLNLDKHNDMIVILKKNNEAQTADIIDNPEARPLLILLGQKNGELKLAAKSNSTVYCYDCGGMMGDPYQGIVIKDGYFSIEHYAGSAWRWSRIITYKFSTSENYWFLHRDIGESFHVSEPDKVERQEKTKKDFGNVKFEDFKILEISD